MKERKNNHTKNCHNDTVLNGHNRQQSRVEGMVGEVRKTQPLTGRVTCTPAASAYGNIVKMVKKKKKKNRDYIPF